IVPSCDFDSLKELEVLVKETSNIEMIGAYKIGFELALTFGLPKVVQVCKKHSKKPIIYDHQKAGTDVPFTGEKFAKVCAKAKVDSVIIFPQSGPETELEWIKALKKEGLKVIVGGEMTHKAYLEEEGGFIRNSAPEEIYRIAAKEGIREFVFPGNKPEKILKYKKILEESSIEPIIYSPGLISQGGSISESGKAAGKNWHAIVGRALYESKDIKKTAVEMCKELQKSI
ncbi:MAG: orotidine 5'-phosphate decarboxylase / HUMPS family protein, partial [Candidatus Diapherotrites archaeon]